MSRISRDGAGGSEGGLQTARASGGTETIDKARPVTDRRGELGGIEAHDRVGQGDESVRRASLRAIGRVSIVAVSLIGSGCGTLPDNQRWGENVTLAPGWSRVGRAARRAFLSPGTWAPAVGALVLTVDDYDRKVSNWARTHNPVFGSAQNASDAGDLLSGACVGVALGSLLATPSGEGVSEWTLAKSKGLAIEGGAVMATAGVSEGLKNLIYRHRPVGRSTSSFPSGHASTAFSLATLTSRNLDSIDIPSEARWGLQAGSYALAGSVAWSRVESGRHFPTDVLAGAAIGHFLSSFIHDAFLGLEEKDFWKFTVAPLDGGAVLEIGWSF